MRIRIEPARLFGQVRAITSKSAAHRSLICAALSRGETVLRISDRSADIDATADCLRAMGADIRAENGLYRVKPIRREDCRNDPDKEAYADGFCPVLNCGESGSTLRFLLPVAAALHGRVRMTGEGRLPKRPLDPLIRVLQEHGTRLEFPRKEEGETLPLEAEGRPSGGLYKIEGNISSQYISGLLFALPLLKENSRIELLTPMESSAYVDMTLQALSQYGVRIGQLWRQEEDDSRAKKRTGFFIPGNQEYRSGGFVDVEGDWSNAAFFLAAGAVAREGEPGIACSGLSLDSVQGDKGVLQILENFGAQVRFEKEADRDAAEAGEGKMLEQGADGNGQKAVLVGPGRLTGQKIDVSQIPDLMPILAVVACRALGRTDFVGAGRLRIKESDRIASTAALITALGGRVQEGEESLTVYGTGQLRGGNVDSFGDHRIAMCAAIAALFCQETVFLDGAEAVNKSYPDFFKDYNALGGNAHVV